MPTSPSLQEQAKALGDPTRHRIFRLIVDAQGPIGIAELTADVGLNHNAVRQHVSQLVDAGLVLRGTEATVGPGRPRLVFEPHPAADGRWGTSGPYQHLSRLLVEMLGTGSTAHEVGRRSGAKVLMTAGRSPVERLEEAIVRGGFDPERRQLGERVEFILRACPFSGVATIDPDTICGLHMGIATGLADQLDGVSVEALHRCDPAHAGCRLQFRVPAGS